MSGAEAAMLLPLVTEAAGKKAAPVIGFRRVTVRHGKKRTVTTTSTFEVTGTQALLAGGLLITAFALGVVDWKEATWKDKDGNEHKINLPGASSGTSPSDFFTNLGKLFDSLIP